MGITGPLRSLLRPRGIAASWGLAEATFFFLVPDILLTRIAIRGLVPALWAAAAAMLGAVLGGIIMYLLGQGAFIAACRFLDFIPAI